MEVSLLADSLSLVGRKGQGTNPELGENPGLDSEFKPRMGGP